MPEIRTKKGKHGNVKYPISKSKTKKYQDSNQLYGHTSEETAYLVDDYPYGYHRRTKIRYWIEHSKKRGDRFCSQTLNPSTNKWNKPKKSTYSGVMAMIKDEKGHVTRESIDYGDKEPKIQTFMDTYQLSDEQETIAKYFIAVDRSSQHYEWKISTQKEGEEINYKEQEKKNQEVIRKAIRYERSLMDD